MIPDTSGTWRVRLRRTELTDQMPHNVSKTGLMIELEKLSVHSSLVEPMVDPCLNR